MVIFIPLANGEFELTVVHSREDYGGDNCNGSQFILDTSSSLLNCHANGFGVKFPQETDVFLGMKNDDNRNRTTLAEGHEDEFDAIFDIIDNFGISIEEGLVFFEKASEWLATRARDEARRMLSTRPRKNEERSVNAHSSLLEGNLLPVEPTLRAQTPLEEHSMSSAVRDRIAVAPGDYLQGEFHVDVSRAY